MIIIKTQEGNYVKCFEIKKYEHSLGTTYSIYGRPSFSDRCEVLLGEYKSESLRNSVMDAIGGLLLLSKNSGTPMYCMPPNAESLDG